MKGLLLQNIETLSMIKPNVQIVQTILGW